MRCSSASVLAGLVALQLIAAASAQSQCSLATDATKCAALSSCVWCPSAAGGRHYCAAECPPSPPAAQAAGASAADPNPKCNTTWGAPSLPEGVFVPAVWREYECVDAAFAAFLPNASWPCAGVGHQLCSAQLNGFLPCTEAECWDQVSGPGHKCSDTGSKDCICEAKKACSGGEPPSARSNAGCPTTFVHNCRDSCGVFVPCSA